MTENLIGIVCFITVYLRIFSVIFLNYISPIKECSGGSETLVLFKFLSQRRLSNILDMTDQS